MYDERFARQYRYEPPSEFPLSLPYARIVHHLSGPNRYAHTQTSLNRLVGCWCKDPSSHFHCASRFNHPRTRTYVRLLGPCFKTGRIEPFSHRIKSGSGFAQPPCAHHARMQDLDSHAANPEHQTHSDRQGKMHQVQKQRCTQTALALLYNAPQPEHKTISPHTTGSIRFPCSKFRHF